MKFHLIPVRVAVIPKSKITNAARVLKERHPDLLGMTICVNHYGKQLWRILRKLKIDLPHDSAVLVLGLYSVEMKSTHEGVTYTVMFLEAKFTTAKI